MRNILCITLLLLAVSCRTPQSKGNVFKTSGDEAVTVRYDNTDTLRSRDFSIFARLYEGIGETEKLPVEIHISTPHGKYYTDTVALSCRDLTDDFHRASGTCDLSRVVYEDAVLGETGTYTFKIRIIKENFPDYLIGIIIE